jgi:hypothetical protein
VKCNFSRPVRAAELSGSVSWATERNVLGEDHFCAGGRSSVRVREVGSRTEPILKKELI